MPWYKLPHADIVMHFDHEMDLEPADAPTGTVDVTAFDDYPDTVLVEPRFMSEPEEEAEAT